jgi:hypothetical protein
MARGGISGAEKILWVQGVPLSILHFSKAGTFEYGVHPLLMKAKIEVKD